MYTVYSLYNPYGNYLDNYYVRDYNSFISFLLETSADIHTQDRVNLGILDGVTIRNNLKGNYREYNVLIVEDEDGNRDLYKITGKTFVRRDIWSIEARLDVFSKNYASVLTADVLVQRLGYKEWDTFSPVLFNDEGFTLSQIKTEQHGITFCNGNIVNNSSYTIGDDIKLCGYLLIFAKDALQSNKSSISLSTTTYTPEADYEVDDISKWAPYQYGIGWSDSTTYFFTYATDASKEVNVCTKLNIKTKRGNLVYDNTYYKYVFEWTVEGNLTRQTGNFTYSDAELESDGLMDDNYVYFEDIWDGGSHPTYEIENSFPSTTISINLRSVCKKATDAIGHANTDTYSYNAYNGKIVHDKASGRYYQITMSGYVRTITATTPHDLTEIWWGDASATPKAYGNIVMHTPITNGYTYSFKEVFPEVTVNENITMNAKINTTDEGNPIIFIPYIETDLPVYVNLTDGSSLEYKQSNILQIIRKMQLQYSGENAVLLDVQKAPFFLVPYMNDGVEPYIRIENNAVYLEGYQAKNVDNYYEIDKTTEYINLIRHALPYAQNIITTNTAQITIEDYKLEQMNHYILRSPSGSSTEDFEPVKNQGVSGWILKYNIRPYESMLQLQPVYSGYYGANFTDTRGVVMLEDISLTEYSSEWETYVRQNINYVNSFESNINYEQSQLSLQQDYEKQSFKIQRIQSGLNAAISWATSGVAAVSQASIGDMGKAIGSAAESVNAVASEAVNAATSKKQLKLQLQYETDQLALQQTEERKQWQYSLGNIQALPLNTDKTCAIYNSNYGVFYYEKYEPTDYEMYVYKNYLDLFGITIGQPVPLTQFEFDYIEANVIKYNKEITYEEYEELQEELKEGRRLYNYVTEK